MTEGGKARPGSTDVLRPAYVWETKKLGRDWTVFRNGCSRRASEYALGKDGLPIRFWSEKSAQEKADSLNRKASK